VQEAKAMLIGVPKEVKPHEFRVGLTATSVEELVRSGYTVLVQAGAGDGIGQDDAIYRRAGATVVDGAEDVYGQADLIVKVKELQPSEYALLRAGQVLFTYLHLAPDRQQATALLTSGCVAIAYETVTDAHGGLPLLRPMSEVAGRLSVQMGAYHLQRLQGGAGLLLGGVPGVQAADVVVLGGGIVGTNAASVAVGLGARVTVLDRSMRRLQELDERFGSKLSTVSATSLAVEKHVTEADLVIGAVLLPGASAPKLVRADVVQRMRQGAVIVDVAIDQGGCFESSHPTTHGDPTYVVDGVVHYCVTNMPSAVARTASHALNNVTLPHVLALANRGYRRALQDNPHLLAGLTVHEGRMTHPAVAEGLGMPYVPPERALGKVTGRGQA
jgi:alanine dehydrogenase